MILCLVAYGTRSTPSMNALGFLLLIVITSGVLEHKWRASLKTIQFLYE